VAGFFLPFVPRLRYALWTGEHFRGLDMAKGKSDGMDYQTMQVHAEMLEYLKGKASELAETLKEAGSRMDYQTMQLHSEMLDYTKGRASELAETLKGAGGEFEKVIRGVWNGCYVTLEDLRETADGLVDYLKQADELLDRVIQKMELLKFKAEESKQAMDDLNG